MKKIRKLTVLMLFCVISALCNSQNISESDTVIRLQEIVVEAHQVRTPLKKITGNVSVLTANELNGTDENNFSSVLQAVPGIYMHSGTLATSRIVMRGVGSRTPYNTNRIKSYLNDIPITSSDGISTPDDIDLSGIYKIEIIKGPTSTLYGSGLGGNIIIHTPTELTNKGQVSVRYGSYNTLKSHVSGSFNSGELAAYGNFNNTQSDGFRENNRFRKTSLLTSGKWTKPTYSVEYTLHWMMLNAQIPSSIGKTLFETNPRAAAANWKAINGYKALNSLIGGVTLDNRITANLKNRLTVFTRWMDSYEKRPFNNLDDGTTSIGVRDKLNIQMNKWDVAFGFEFSNDTYNWKMDKDEIMLNKNAERRNQLSIFGLAYFRPTEKWNLTLGGAVDKISYHLTDLFPDNGNQSGSRNFPPVFSPRAGLNYSFSNAISAFASPSYGFSMPSPEETLTPEGMINKELRPERGIQAEMGVRMHLFGGKTQIETTLYQIWLSNLLVTKRLSEDIFTGINAGKTRQQGVEVTVKQQVLELDYFPGNLQISANYTLSDHVFLDFTDDGMNFNGKKLPGIPFQMAYAAINWAPIHPLHIKSQCQFVGSQFMNDANTEKSDKYFTIALRADYQLINFSKKGVLLIFGGVNNLTNAVYASMISVNALSVGGNEPRYYYPGLPRHFYSGIKLEF